MVVDTAQFTKRKLNPGYLVRHKPSGASACYRAGSERDAEIAFNTVLKDPFFIYWQEYGERLT
jgi:hypothetical protein